MNTTQQENTRIGILQAFEDGLLEIGYSEQQIKRDYGYSNFLEDGRRGAISLAAFGGAVPSLRTCNIGVEVASEVTAAHLQRFRSLGAPLLFAYDPLNGQLSRWRMTKQNSPDRLNSLDITPDNLPRYFADNREKWNPDTFRQARAATFRESAPQLDFFDAGLLPALEDQLQRKLSNQIQNITARSREILNGREGDTAFEQQFPEYARLLFRLLAARLLSDRGDIETLTESTDVSAVLNRVEAKYHIGEAREPALENAVVQDQVWKALRTGLDLRNLSPETLAFVYENTLVDPDLRKRNGIHSTPPMVADYLLRQLPIERLPEAERVVFEPFCGNAPFLLAAMRRLRELLPSTQTASEVHNYLVDRLLGIELLPFAREIARYSLILGDYPNENSWQIAQGDAFKDTRFDSYLERVNIVLCNPPHESFPVDRRPADIHHNQAAEALRRVLKNPPSLLGFVMPLAFVDGVRYKALRRELVETYPSLAVTALPDTVFGNASQQTALIAAHRLDTEKRYVWAGISPNDYRNTFPLTGEPTYRENRTELPLSSDGMPILWRRREEIDGFWDFLADFRTLSSVAELHRGLQWKKQNEQTASTSTAVFNDEQEGTAPGIYRANSAVESYIATRFVYLNVLPTNSYRNALRLDWSKPKVLVNAARTSNNTWRMVALSDKEGLFASQRFIGIWPRTVDSIRFPVEVLSAVINGPITNAFIYQRCRGRDNEKNVVGLIPIPSFSGSQVQEITKLVNAYIDLRWENIDMPAKWTGRLAEQGRLALLKIDAAVLDAYGLPAELETEFLRSFDGLERGHLPFAFTGYDPAEWAEAKAELADERQAKRIADAFLALLKKKNLSYLTPSEQEEYDRLQSLRSGRQSQYRTLIASGK